MWVPIAVLRFCMENAMNTILGCGDDGFRLFKVGVSSFDVDSRSHPINFLTLGGINWFADQSLAIQENVI